MYTGTIKQWGHPVMEVTLDGSLNKIEAYNFMLDIYKLYVSMKGDDGPLTWDIKKEVANED
jgi:hypothetical protein